MFVHLSVDVYMTIWIGGWWWMSSLTAAPLHFVFRDRVCQWTWSSKLKENVCGGAGRWSLCGEHFTVVHCVDRTGLSDCRIFEKEDYLNKNPSSKCTWTNENAMSLEVLCCLPSASTACWVWFRCLPPQNAGAELKHLFLLLCVVQKWCSVSQGCNDTLQSGYIKW